MTFLNISFLNAQSALDNLIFEDAKTAYTSKNYSACLEKLNELENKGITGLIIAHLKIMATSKLDPSKLGYKKFMEFKNDVEFYLKNYDNEDFYEQLKDVYEIQKSLLANNFNEGHLCAIEGDNHYNNKDYKSSYEWYLKALDKNYRTTNIYDRLGYIKSSGIGGIEINYLEAIKWYKYSNDLIPNRDVCIANIGVCYQNIKDYENAKLYYEQALKINPNSLAANKNLGSIILLEASEITKQINSLNSLEEDDNQYKALKEQQIRIYEKAVPYLENAYKLDRFNNSIINSIIKTKQAIADYFMKEPVIDYKKAEKYYLDITEIREFDFGALSKLYAIYTNYKKSEPYNLAKAELIVDKIQNVSKIDESRKVEYQRFLGDRFKVDKNMNKAIEWYTKAAERGSTAGQYNLGLIYYKEGITNDYGKSVYWMSKAAENGNIHAMVDMGIIYAEGKALEQDYIKAKYWYEKAAEEGGNMKAMNSLGGLYAEGNGVVKDYTKALEWYLKAGDYGFALANVGILYFEGEGVEKDYEKALEYFEKAETKITDNYTIYNCISSCYFHLKNYEKSIENLNKVLKLNPEFSEAYASFGEIYLKLDNREKAIENYIKAADMGYEKAFSWLKENKVKYKSKK